MKVRTERDEQATTGRVIIDFADERERLRIMRKFSVYGPMCMDPDACVATGRCDRDPNCAD